MIQIARLHGGRMADKKFMNPRFATTIFLCIFAFIMQINGFIHVWPDFIRICNSLLLDSFGAQLVMRFAVRFLTDHEQDVFIIEKTIFEFYEKEEQNLENQKFLNLKANFIDMALKFYMILNGILFHVPILTSIILSVLYKDFIPFAPFFVPFIDSEQFWGFILNEILMTLQSTMFYVVLVVVDLIYLYYTLQTLPMSEVLAKKITEYGEVIKKNQSYDFMLKFGKFKKNENAQHDVKKEIVKLITEFNSYNNFILSLINYIYLPIFSVIMTNAIAIGLSILVAMYFSVPIGFSIGLIFFLQVLLTCVEGAIISHHNQKIINAVYDFPWYELSASNQKIWLQLLHQCQNASEVKIMIFGLLNMERFTDAVKTAYSSLMFVLKLVK